MKVDYLIVGQGLAGSALSMALLELGASVLVVDKEAANSASKVAAGLVTTVAGKGMNLSWRQAEYLPQAVQYYQDLERRCGTKLFHSLDLLRMFSDEKSRAKFLRKQEQLEAWVADAPEDALADWKSEFGGFIMKHGGWLDTNAYLQEVRTILADAYRVAEFSEADLVYFEDSVKWQDVEAKKVILCQGAFGLTAEDGGLFSSVKHRCAKGEILRIELKGKPQQRIINRDGWMVPLGNEQWRVGATYEWNDMSGSATEAGRRAVLERVKTLTDSEFAVLEHTAAVRPIIRQSQPYIGLHPEKKQVGFFNGLGSKGVITAPSVARHFAQNLVNGKPLDPELELL